MDAVRIRVVIEVVAAVGLESRLSQFLGFELTTTAVRRKSPRTTTQVVADHRTPAMALHCNPPHRDIGG